ncbi:hypothetical protein TthHB5018_b23530 (plasmid) [Thermus thermophilus]|uniref:DsrE family protein n=1 Tax=Thermus thermophilus TaxID=274 RepID=A0A7R7YJ86_THETH|nr:hypothetical protein TthHB5018_b23530 [Thermus thermophilus]
MRVAYVLSSPRAASHKLGQMILPQLEAGTHGVEVVGIFFFDDNTLVLQKGNPIGERLAKVAKEKGILLMMCDLCALERGLAEGEPRWCTPEGEGRKTPGTCRVSPTWWRGGGGVLPRPLPGFGGPGGPGDHPVAVARRAGKWKGLPHKPGPPPGGDEDANHGPGWAGAGFRR